MRSKNEVDSQNSDRRGPKAGYGHDERMFRHKSKATDSQDGRDGSSPLPRHRSMAIRAHERERDRDGIAHHQSRSSHASKPVSSEEAKKAMRTLYMEVKETTAFFTDFEKEYRHDVRAIGPYAGEAILEKLWERKIKHNNSKGRSSKEHPKDDGAGSHPAFEDVSKRLWGSLQDAFEGARCHPSGHDASLARKLDTAINDFGRLLPLVRTHFQEMDSLIKELKLLKVVLDLEVGSAGTASGDDKAKQRPKGRANGHGHQRNSSSGHEETRYGGMGGDSGSEDNGQHDEQHGEHTSGGEEGEVGGDEESKGLNPTKQPVQPSTDV